MWRQIEDCKKEKAGSTEIWTRIAGFRVQSANQYTIESWLWIKFACKTVMICIGMWRQIKVSKRKRQVLPRFELGSLDSESRVLTITP